MLLTGVALNGGRTNDRITAEEHPFGRGRKRMCRRVEIRGRAAAQQISGVPSHALGVPVPCCAVLRIY